MNTASTRVCVRFSPSVSNESNQDRCIQHLSEKEVGNETVFGLCIGFKVGFTTPSSEDTNVFHFDHVFGSRATQSDIYAFVQPIVQGILNGLNGTILAYGQTGSGKTHTLVGDLENEGLRGIVPRAIKELMEASHGISILVTLSVAEIYCERIFDLLKPSNTDLQIKQDENKGVYVAGLVEMTVANEWELNQIMQLGFRNRTVSKTHMNEQSSRSHCIVTVQFISNKTDQPRMLGKLYMVDLAGSERTSKTGATGVTLEEGILINKSLSALANVIGSLTDNKSRHVPYRDSKLTRVLQESIGGNSQTAMIICCSLSANNYNETISSLRFGSRARGITNTIQPRSNSTSIEQQLKACEAECSKLKQEIELLKMNTHARIHLFDALKHIYRQESFHQTKNVSVLNEISYLLRTQEVSRFLFFVAFVIFFLIEDWFLVRH